MKYSIISSIGIFALSAVTAVAGSPVPATQPVVVINPAAPETVWDGFYAGVNVASSSGVFAIDDGGSWSEFDDQPFWDGKSTGFGAQLGYNHQVGSFVVGIEAAYSSGFSGAFSGIVDLEGHFENVLSGGVRVGFSTGDLLIYGAVSAVAATGTHAQSDDSVSGDMTGVSYGGGLEYMITDHMSARLDYRVYEMDPIDLDMAAIHTDRSFEVNDAQSISLGLNWHF